MDERRFRFDLFVAVCALLLSGLAAGAAAYQTYVINEQFSATVWPYLDLNATYTTNSVRFELRNDGLGPALLRSATLMVDGKPSSSWLTLLAKYPHPVHGSILGTLASLGDGDVIRSGESKAILDLRGALPPAKRLLAWESAHRVALDVCYCSLLQRCWTVQLITQAGSPQPQDVRRCPPPHSVLGT
ncbi:MAG TPA: hypothetical protein VMF61_06845 [Candidatus Acidoferrales bacterium]|nr:hypothetical protein [Candidatus Acidoferrales bacterium]